jgi:hypothetical protein
MIHATQGRDKGDSEMGIGVFVGKLAGWMIAAPTWFIPEATVDGNEEGDALVLPP